MEAYQKRKGEIGSFSINGLHPRAVIRQPSVNARVSAARWGPPVGRLNAFLGVF